jgi:hypothetical protein
MKPTALDRRRSDSVVSLDSATNQSVPARTSLAFPIGSEPFHSEMLHIIRGTFAVQRKIRSVRIPERKVGSDERNDDLHLSVRSQSNSFDRMPLIERCQKYSFFPRQ